MDGDVEDEVDDSEDDSGRSEKSSKSTSSKRDRERNGSKSPPYRSKSGSGKKEYRSLGVQTLPKDVRSVGVQVSQPAILSPTGNNFGRADDFGAGSGRGALSHKKAGKMRQRTSSSGTSATSGTSLSSIASHIELGKPGAAQELKYQQEQLASSSPGLANIQSFIRPPSSRQHSGGLPSGALSPRMNEFGYGQDSPNRTPTGGLTPPGLHTKPVLQNIQTQRQAPPMMSNPPSLITRASSSSTTESTGPLSPVDTVQQVPAVVRKSSGRTWNPATGVDVFKRGSEEVLARFLRMGSWEEESPTGNSPSQTHGGLRT